MTPAKIVTPMVVWMPAAEYVTPTRDVVLDDAVGASSPHSSVRKACVGWLIAPINVIACSPTAEAAGCQMTVFAVTVFERVEIATTR
jgi:hypothetical protein